MKSMQVYSTVTTRTGNHRQLATKHSRNKAANSAAACVVFSFVCYVAIGVFALFTSSVRLPSWIIEENGHCMRASRASDFPVVSLAIGSPPRTVKLLVRLGNVVEHASSAMVIFSEESMRSDTLRCSDDRTCTDIAIMTSDAGGAQTRAVVGFKYGNQWSTEFSTERAIGVEGSVSLVRGMEYDLNPTHFCFRDAPSTDGFDTDGFDVYALNVTGSDIYVNSDSSDRTLGSSAFECNQSVSLFPMAASNERSWLALSNDLLYEASTSRLEDRRNVVERGLECAEEGNEKEIYELDCHLDLQSNCQTKPSIPFRRVSQFEVRISLHSNASQMAVRQRIALSRLAGSNTIQDAVFFAMMRLIVLLIVAFVVFNRAERVSSSAFSILKSSIDITRGKEKHANHTLFGALSDAAIGALAIVSRALIIWHQASVLSDDGNNVVVVFEIIGVFVSIIHFFMRNLVLKTDLQKEAPLSKLGGSMSIVDACVAALFSVIQTPSLGASSRDFDAVSRLFCAVLIALFCIHRLFFSITACALLASTTASNNRFDRSYSITLWISCVLWFFQTCILSLSFSRLFIISQSYSLVRFTVGDFLTTEIAIFLGCLTLSIPYFNSVSARIV